MAVANGVTASRSGVRVVSFAKSAANDASARVSSCAHLA
jgi:hypothetical protein